jgi:hypothetical protein
MIIRLAKGKRDKPPTLTCLRGDGTSTWQRSTHYFAHHDLIHYAVETTLGYREAFLGLVAAGKDLDAFGTQNAVKDVYTLQEGWAEALVGLLQLPAGEGGAPLRDQELLDQLAKICTENGVPAPLIVAEQLGRIRARMRTLHETWDQLPEDGVMELTF